MENEMSERTSFAWVIERDIHSQLHYWAGRNGDDWRSDHSEALRFARRADAELMLTYHCAGVGRVVEHGWASSPSPAVRDDLLAALAKIADGYVGNDIPDEDWHGLAVALQDIARAAIAKAKEQP
jgi:hypothetical protein